MSEEQTIYIAEPESKADAELGNWWQKQWLESVERLETAARQLITIATALIGLQLGLLALTETPLPSYMQSDTVRVMATLAVLLLLGAVGAALGVVWPQSWADMPARPDVQRENLRALVGQKRQWLVGSGVLFFCGLFCLGVVIVLAVWWV